jgi:coproporphyrinogen III oxidase-like Fe-S oxidoreductase
LDETGAYKMQAAFMEYKPDNFLAIYDKPAFQKITILKEKEIIDEILMMGLRLADGICDAKLKELTGKNFSDVLDVATLSNFLENDIVYLNDNILRINPKSLILNNYIVSRLLKI